MVSMSSSTKIVINENYASQQETDAYLQIGRLLEECPIPSSEFQANLALFLNRSSLSRILFLSKIYQRILPVHGSILEFGVRWGQNLALFTTLRTIFEPYNTTRKIVGFDTFEGFPSINSLDGNADSVTPGAFSVTDDYVSYLTSLLSAHEQLAPRSQIEKYQLRKGDVIDTLPKYLEEHPETIIALAYFDLDLFEPTRNCLQLIGDYLTKGSVVVFDELALKEFPGETIALREAWGTKNYRIQRDSIVPNQAFIVFE